MAVAAPLALTGIYVQVGHQDLRIGTVFVVVVVVVAVVCGPRPDWVALVLSTLGFWYTIVPPTGEWGLTWPDGFLSLAVFVLVGATVIVVVIERDRRVLEAVDSERRYRRLSDAGIVGTVFWDATGRCVDANDAFLAMIGRRRSDLVGGAVSWAELTPAEYLDVDAAAVDELDRTGASSSYEKQLLRPDGSRVAVVIASAFLEDSRERGISLVVDVSDRWALEAAQADLLASERSAREAAVEGSRRLELILEASASMMQATEPDEVLDRLVAALAGPVGSYAAVFLPEGDLLHRAAARHVARDVTSLVGAYPLSSTSQVPAAEAFRTGIASEFGGDVEEMARSISDADDYARVVMRLGVVSGVAAPLRARGQRHGAVVVGRSEREAAFTHEDVAMVQAIADRAAAAYLNTSDLQAERRIATQLQEALLPKALTVPADHRVGAVYVPAGRGRHIGGDWWDFFPIDEHRFAIAVGDAMGHGIGAAAVMAETRNAIRGLLAHGATPSQALASASRLLQSARPAEMATVFLATYAPESGELVYASAGHPPALLLGDDSTRLLEEGRSTPLGIDEGPRRDATVRVPSGFALVAYTDSLVETPTQPIDIGIEELGGALARLGQLAPQERAERVAAELAGTDAEDDVCLVILAQAPGPTVRGAGPTVVAGGRADESTPVGARRR